MDKNTDNAMFHDNVGVEMSVSYIPSISVNRISWPFSSTYTIYTIRMVSHTSVTVISFIHSPVRERKDTYMQPYLNLLSTKLSAAN